MTQEEKQLLLKDLCARLPYGFFVHRYSDNANIRIDDIDTFSRFLEYSESEEFKPYLRPMSSMTEEEWNEFHSLNNVIRLFDKRICVDKSNFGCFSELEDCYKAIDWLNEHQFDYRGLIPMGLAIEAPEDMYNTKTE